MVGVNANPQSMGKTLIVRSEDPSGTRLEIPFAWWRGVVIALA